MRGGVVTLVLALALGACGGGSSEDGDGAPAAAAAGVLDTTWTMIEPGGDTRCALDTDYVFFARNGDPERLLVHFQGGGACASGEACDPEGNPTYSRDADETDDPARRGTGIFDLGNPANPVRDYSMVMVPYCTGDVHLGDAVHTYTWEDDEGTTRDVTVHHKGYANAMAALDWTVAGFESPREIVVTGSSAGSIAVPFYADVLKHRYPDAEIVALGDASGSYRREPGDETGTGETWNLLEVVQRQHGYEDFVSNTISVEHLYGVTGAVHPEIRLTQFDTAHDDVQRFFLQAMVGEGEIVADNIALNQEYIRTAAPGFRSFLAGGTQHTILGRDAFYRYAADGITFRDWFAAAVAGESLQDVTCTDGCARAELVLSEEDALIAERTREMLAEANLWRRPDDGRCDRTAAMQPLRCALVIASADVLGAPNADAGGVLEAMFEAHVRLAGEPYQGSSLVAYNNHPDVTLADIHDLLDTVASRARQ